MKPIIAAGLLAMTLAACGGSPKTSFVDACMQETGEDRAQCTCMADKMEEALGRESFAELGKALNDNRGDLEQAVESLPTGSQFQVMISLAAVSIACSVGE